VLRIGASAVMPRHCSPWHTLWLRRLPPGANYPKTASVAFAHPEDTRLGQQFAGAAHEHQGYSAFRVVGIGVDGFQLRMQLIDALNELSIFNTIFRATKPAAC